VGPAGNVVPLGAHIRHRRLPLRKIVLTQLSPDCILLNDLNHFQLGDKSLQLLAAGWPNLVDIELSGCHKLTGTELIQFVPGFNQLKSLGIITALVRFVFSRLFSLPTAFAPPRNR